MTQPAWLTQNIHTKLMEVRNQATELAFAASGTARLFAGKQIKMAFHVNIFIFIVFHYHKLACACILPK